MKNNWKKVKLGDITTKIGSGATPTGGKNSYGNHGISLIRSLNVYDFKFEEKNLAFINDIQAKKLQNVEICENDILLNITGASVGRCCIVPKEILPARVNQHVSIIRIKKESADAHFVFYYINSFQNKNRFLGLAQGGATREALTKTTIENYEIDFPSLPIQQKIASVLSAYDDLIEVNNKRIKILEEMAQRIYNEWFVEFKFPGHEKVKIKNCVPEGWEEREVKDFVEFERGIEPGSKNYLDKKNKGSIPFLRVGDLGSRSSNIFIEEELAKGKILNKDDIAVSMDGTVGIVKNGLYGAYSTGIRKLVIKEDVLSKAFLYNLMKSEDIQNTIKAHAQGATILHASRSIDYMRFVFPPADLMGEFNEIVEPTLNLRINLKESVDNLRETRDLILPKLMSGEIDL